MVLENRLIIVTKCLSVAHGNQERVGNTRMLNVAKEACEESAHDVQVAKVSHQVPLLRKVVVVARYFDDLCQVMVAILLVSGIFDTVN